MQILLEVDYQSSSKLFTGNIIIRPLSTTLFGFLRSNGALVSKTTYTDLYAIISDTYLAFITHYYNKPSKQQQIRLILNRVVI